MSKAMALLLPRPAASGVPVSRSTAGHLRRETKPRQQAGPTASVACETVKRETLTYHVLPAPLPFHDSFHNRLFVVKSAPFVSFLISIFYSPLFALFFSFRVSFLSFHVSQAWWQKRKRKGGGLAGQRDARLRTKRPSL
jgi:hypothetical protein